MYSPLFFGEILQWEPDCKIWIALKYRNYNHAYSRLAGKVLLQALGMCKLTHVMMGAVWDSVPETSTAMATSSWGLTRTHGPSSGVRVSACCWGGSSTAPECSHHPGSGSDCNQRAIPQSFNCLRWGRDFLSCSGNSWCANHCFGSVFTRFMSFA